MAVHLHRSHPDFLPLLLAINKNGWTFVLLSAFDAWLDPRNPIGLKLKLWTFNGFTGLSVAYVT